jgi:hypothetical protein
VYRRRAISGMYVTRLRVLRRGWGKFTAENVRVDADPANKAESVVLDEIDLTESLDLDDEDAETGLPFGRERPN